jgi:hypothetical protein
MKYRNSFPIYLSVSIFTLLILVSGLVPGRLSQASAPKEFIPEGNPYPNFDIRAEQYLNTEPVIERSDDGIKTKLALEPQAAARASMEQRVSGLQMRLDPAQESPRLLFSYDQPLTEPSSEPAEAITRKFLRQNRDLYGLKEEIDNLKLVRNYRTEHNGAKHISYQQEYDGLEIFGAEARFTLTRDGEILIAGSDLVPVKKAGRFAPALKAREALRLAAANVGIELDPSIVSLKSSKTRDQAVTFSAGQQFEYEPSAKLMLFPMKRDHLIPTWQVRLVDKRSGNSYAIFVDAEKGTILLRHNLTWYFADAPSFRVFTTNSPQPNLPFVSLNPPFTDRQLVSTNGDPTASPNGWVNPAQMTTIGNNVVAQVDRNNSNSSTNNFRPTVTDSLYDFPLVLATVGEEPEKFPSASVTNLFYWVNRIHDYYYRLGFTEAAGNFQSDNFGRGGVGNDPIMADAQDGGGLNNANFSTSEDGRPGNRMQMYLWNRSVPKIDGSFDAEVITHEYTHGLSSRLVGGPQNVITLFGLQSGGMGEGWSDWYAMSILSKPGDDPRAKYPFGNYVVRDFERGIRRFAYSTDMSVNPLTYADLDPFQSRFVNGDPTEVHRVGEIWCQALWDVRADFIDAYGFEQGKQLIEQLVTDGMKLTPANPTFIDGRDAILLADQLNNGGANQCLIWRGFAKRGVGFSAFSVNGSSSRVKQAFDLPPYCQKAGSVTLDRNGYANGETVKITLGDADLAGSGGATVTITSASTGDRETLSLSEDSKVRGQFTGNIVVAFATPAVGDRILQSAIGDTFTVTYDDASTGQNGPGQAIVKARGVRLQTLLEDSIENGAASLKPDNVWQITTQAFHSPTHSWTDSPLGPYLDETNASLKSKNIKLGGLIGSRLIFWQKFDFEAGYDFGLIEVKVGSKPWQAIASFTGTQNDFRETTIDLSRFDGEDKVKVRFRLVSDVGKVGDGWYIDDVKVVAGATN